jgi:prepilin-type N-terminal cleavage/methylation domain-containing protein
MKNRGFTLVELLVVIAIIGVLAGVLLMTIDPLEQINKGKDGGSINRSKELVDAATRWYATRQTEPTCDGTANSLVGTELKSNFSCTGLILGGSAGVYDSTFTPLSKAYAAKCGGRAVGTETCIVPTEFQ